MSSFGESSIQVNSRIVGLLRVKDVRCSPAEYPRLTFALGVQLQEHPTDEFSSGRPLVDFELRDLRGEVRLEENSRALGFFSWAGQRRHVRSARYVSEGDLEVTCELDHGRIERFEAHRNGGEAILYLASWPTLVDKQGFLDVDIATTRIAIPRDKWLQVLDALSHVRHTLLEIPHPGVPTPQFDAALGHLKDATSRIDRGDYDEAVAACRRSIEAMLKVLSIGGKAGALEAALTSVSDDKRAKAYAGIVSRIKELGNYTIHRAEAPGRYSRAEARFAVGTAHHALTLLATLLSDRRS
jgi:HEPN domain-containing protein